MEISVLYYLVTRLDEVRTLTVVLLIFLPILSLFVTWVIYYMLMPESRYNYESGEQRAYIKKYTKKCVRLTVLYGVLFVVGLVLLALIPSTKDGVIMAGLNKVQNSPEVSNVANAIYEKLLSILK